MSSNNVRHPVTKIFTTLHPTTLHSTCRHFTSYRVTFTQLHFTTLSFSWTPFKIPYRSVSPNITIRHLTYTSLYFIIFFFLSFYIFYISNYCTEYGKYQNLHILFQITNIMQNFFILQQYVRYTTILNMFRAVRCSSSGGQIVLLQPLVSSVSVNSRTVCRLRADCSCK